MSNNASRKGIGVDRSEYDTITALFRSFGIQFTVEKRKPRKLYDVEFEATGRRLTTYLHFETTSLVFSAKGRYLGRIYMSRDECDYFNAPERMTRSAEQKTVKEK